MTQTKRVIGLSLGCLLVLGAAGSQAQDWPQWRGPNRDNKVVGFTVPKAWPKALTQKWTTPVGIGVSSPVLVGDKLYTIGKIGGDETTTCLDAVAGKVLWQDKYPAATVNKSAAGYAGPRSTPAVAGGKVFTLGVDGTVSCLDADSGKVVWRKPTKKFPRSTASCSPLIVDGKCIVFLDALVALDTANGDVKWTGPKGTKDGPYGSPILMTVDGVKQIVTPTANALVGVALADGKELWKKDLPGSGYTINYGTPVIDKQTVYYWVPNKGGKGTSMAFKIEKKDDGFAVNDLWKGGGSYQYNTPVLKDGLLFGLSSSKNFCCWDAKTGKELWKDTTARAKPAASSMPAPCCWP